MTTTRDPAGANVARLAHNELGRLAGWCGDRRYRVLSGPAMAAAVLVAAAGRIPEAVMR